MLPALSITVLESQYNRAFSTSASLHLIGPLCDMLPQAKKVTRHLQKSAAATGHGYTNAENPFGDANVTQRFVWGKKIEKQLQEGADVRDLTAKAEKERQLERLVRAPPVGMAHTFMHQAGGAAGGFAGLNSAVSQELVRQEARPSIYCFRLPCADLRWLPSVGWPCYFSSSSLLLMLCTRVMWPPFPTL